MHQTERISWKCLSMSAWWKGWLFSILKMEVLRLVPVGSFFLLFLGPFDIFFVFFSSAAYRRVSRFISDPLYRLVETLFQRLRKEIIFQITATTQIQRPFSQTWLGMYCQRTGNYFWLRLIYWAKEFSMNRAKQIWNNVRKSLTRKKINTRNHWFLSASPLYDPQSESQTSAWLIDWLIAHETKSCHAYFDDRFSEHCRISNLAWKWKKLIYLIDSERFAWHLCVHL